MKLTRLTDSPILNPIEKNNWEKAAVFNAAAVYHNEKFQSSTPYFLQILSWNEKQPPQAWTLAISPRTK